MHFGYAQCKQKGFTPILILILIALGIGGYFLYNNYSNLSRVQSRDNHYKTPSQNNFDETANWETYQNTKHGYSFKYPSSLPLNENIDGNVFVDNIFIRVVPIPQEYDRTKSENVTKDELETAQRASVNERFLHPITKRELIKMGEKTIDGVLFTKLQWGVYGPLDNPKQTYQEALVGIKGNNLYILPSYESYPAPQILSTFKFTQ